MKAKDLTGQRFGRLTVTDCVQSKQYKSGQTHAQFKCKCDCGAEIIVTSINLKTGNTKSCGCLRRDIMRQCGKDGYSHNMSKSRFYRIWNGMKQRCYNPNFPKFKDYGARGITVCDEWKNSFETFYEDESYKGENDEWHFPAYAAEDTYIHKNERICQFRIIQHQPLIQLKEVKMLGNKDRGGIGSTGSV